MSNFTRRDVCLSLPALNLFSALSREVSAQAQVASAQAVISLAANAPTTDFSNCKAFPFSQLSVRFSDNGNATRDIAHGTVPTGEIVELHESTIGPGKMPHAPHQHPHEEFIFISEGTMDFMYGGESHILSPGSVGYTAPNQMHGMKNVGSTQANYFIFSLSKK